MRLLLFLISLFLLLTSASCSFQAESNPIEKEDVIEVPKEISFKDTFNYLPTFISDRFDYPVGKPNAKGYYNAQKFGINSHLGEDWNATTGGNSDLGAPIYVIANGYVKFAEDIGQGWGNVIRVLHQLPDGQQVESLYAHCHEMMVQKGDWIIRGQQVGTIGNVNGMYYAHLHFEIRHDTELPIGGGYSTDTTGFLYPTKFIQSHRKIE